MFERIAVKKINSHVWLMDDNHEATGYLVVGNKKALVIDTMNGVENVLNIVRTITDLPVTVINTHGHCDHIYGNVFFEDALIHELDLPIAYNHMNFPEFKAELEKRGLTMPPYETVKDGDRIDLGGLHVRLIALSGHTPGGILVLLEEDRILFTGDAINRHLWMQLDESLPMESFYENLKSVMYLKNEADFILHGHAHDLENISLMDELLKGVFEICQGQTENDKAYHWFGGEGRQHEFAKNSVICYKQK